MIRWLPIVWPPWWSLLIAAFFYAAIECHLLIQEWLLRRPFISMHDAEVQKLLGITIGFVTFVYTVYRVAAFHPLLRPDYTQWLKATPWTARKRLPLGPVHLVWQDLILVTIVVVVCWPRLQERALMIAQFFVVVYAAILGLFHGFTCAKSWGYAVGFGVGAMVLCALNPWVFPLVAAVTYIIAYLGLRVSLARFPWEGTPVQQAFKAPSGSKNRALGWPYDRVGPRPTDTYSIPLSDALAISALTGWLFFAVSYNLRSFPDAMSGRFVVCIGILLVAAVARVLLYCFGYCPPLNLLGRLLLGRWIIAGYDQVFVAPLLTVAVCTAAWYFPISTGVDSLWTTPFAFAAGWLVLLGMGPSLQVWRLTGNHRISPGVLTTEYAR
jgi:hypothetical protein